MNNDNDDWEDEEYVSKTQRKREMSALQELGESIAIDDHIKIVVVQIKGKQVRLGIKAPKETKIHREEVYKAIQEQNTQASQADMSAISSLSDELNKK